MSGTEVSAWRTRLGGLTPRVGRRLLSTWYAYMLTYRGEIVLWMVATCLPLIMMGIWLQAGRSGAFAELTPASVARYFLAVFVVRQITVVWVAYEFEEKVVTGKLSPMLLQPLDPVYHSLASHLAEQATRLPFFALVLGMALWIYPDAARGEDGRWFLPSPGRWLGFVAAVYAAFAFRFLLQHTLALGAFWVERVSAVEKVNYLPYLFLSGLLYPLEAVPEGVRSVLLWTPFPYLIWFPARLLTATDASTLPVTRAVVVLGACMVSLFVLNRWFWRRGLRRYSGMGA